MPALIVLALAAVSVLAAAYSLARVHRAEVTMRMILGSSPARAIGDMLGGAVAYASAGAVMGIAAGVAVARAASNLWYGVDSVDATSLFVASTVAILPLVLTPAILARWSRSSCSLVLQD
jgi:hypothetical protein